MPSVENGRISASSAASNSAASAAPIWLRGQLTREWQLAMKSSTLWANGKANTSRPARSIQAWCGVAGGVAWSGSRHAAGGTRPVNGNGTGLAGHGLAGMRERVALLGGRLQAGPQYGGFAVRAELPAELPASGALLPTGDA